MSEKNNRSIFLKASKIAELYGLMNSCGKKLNKKDSERRKKVAVESVCKYSTFIGGTFTKITPFQIVFHVKILWWLCEMWMWEKKEKKNDENWE